MIGIILLVVIILFYSLIGVEVGHDNLSEILLMLCLYYLSEIKEKIKN